MQQSSKLDPQEKEKRIAVNSLEARNILYSGSSLGRGILCCRARSSEVPRNGVILRPPVTDEKHACTQTDVNLWKGMERTARHDPTGPIPWTQRRS